MSHRKTLTYLRAITSYTPTDLGDAQEHLSCGHDGCISPVPVIAQRMQDGRGRCCSRCAHTAFWTRQRAICRSKVRYETQVSAMPMAMRWHLHCYRCHICKGWHLTSEGSAEPSRLQSRQRGDKVPGEGLLHDLR
jgi:hypothetical protein